MGRPPRTQKMGLLFHHRDRFRGRFGSRRGKNRRESGRRRCQFAELRFGPEEGETGEGWVAAAVEAVAVATDSSGAGNWGFAVAIGGCGLRYAVAQTRDSATWVGAKGPDHVC